MFWTKQNAETSGTNMSTVKDWLVELVGGQKTTSNIKVNSETALQVNAVYACVRLLAESVARLPLDLYKRKGKVKSLSVVPSV